VLPHSNRQPIPGKSAIVLFDAIQQQYSQNPQAGPVQLICSGALSNAARLLLLYPEVKPLMEISIMSGAMGVSEGWLWPAAGGFDGAYCGSEVCRLAVS
jgi:inosine-uridine nucleoside N-ribohydrolase